MEAAHPTSRASLLTRCALETLSTSYAPRAASSSSMASSMRLAVVARAPMPNLFCPMVSQLVRRPAQVHSVIGTIVSDGCGHSDLDHPSVPATMILSGTRDSPFRGPSRTKPASCTPICGPVFGSPTQVFDSPTRWLLDEVWPSQDSWRRDACAEIEVSPAQSADHQLLLLDSSRKSRESSSICMDDIKVGCEWNSAAATNSSTVWPVLIATAFTTGLTFFMSFLWFAGWIARSLGLLACCCWGFCGLLSCSLAFVIFRPERLLAKYLHAS